MNVEIRRNESIADGIFRLVLRVPQQAQNGQAGQFINLYLPGADLLLPRPFGITNASGDVIEIVYAVVGAGTQRLSRLKAGEIIRALGPNGTGFDLAAAGRKVMLIGGGLGIPPLLFAARQLRENAGTEAETKIAALLGFRERPYYSAEFRAYCDKVFVISEKRDALQRRQASSGDAGDPRVLRSGSDAGITGTVVDLLNRLVADGQLAVTGTAILACGPVPMLRAVGEWAAKQGIPAQLSLEARMGCGYGVCVGCSVEVCDSGSSGAGTVKKKVCTDGPVFDAERIVWDWL
jgi:dihydroorotate dehydrogenase electron transfer subunit